MKILVTGATGYVGGRLIPQLIEKEHEIHVLARNPKRVIGRKWETQVQIIQGDLLDDSPISIPNDIEVAYYLVHSMSDTTDFQRQDAKAANKFVSSLPNHTHIVYLGGIKPEGDNISAHLNSRLEVGEILSKHRSTTELRAGPVIGSGSASFEMVRNLTERLPIMIAPKWVNNRIRPIAIRDVLSYLSLSAEIRPVGHYDIGGDTLTFLEMMMQWAEVRNLKRIILPVPILAPWLASRWVGFITPISNKIAVPLVKGMLTSITGDTSRSQTIFPNIHPINYKEAVHLAQSRIEKNFIETRWSDSQGEFNPFILEEREGIIHETRSIQTHASPKTVYDVFSSAGGEVGWFAWNWAWKIRGFLDLLVGGPGLRRGRRHPKELLTGESVDFWRVEEAKTNHHLRLRAEMKVPGQAWLEWKVSSKDNITTLTQTAFFNPSGITGRLYWISLYPVHGFIFGGMVKNIIKKAESIED